jgi:hypothetical protein
MVGWTGCKLLKRRTKMTTRMNLKPRKEQRRKDAEARQSAYNTLTPGEKLLAAGAKQKAKILKKGVK